MERERGKHGKLSQLKLKILNTCEVWEGKRNWKLKIRICRPRLCCGHCRWKAFSLHFALTFPFSAFVLADKSFKSCDCGRQHIPWCCLYRWNQGPLKDPEKKKKRLWSSMHKTWCFDLFSAGFSFEGLQSREKFAELSLRALKIDWNLWSFSSVQCY